MLIRVLPALNHRDHWINLCQRESPYCFVETPETLIDFQSGYLQITLLHGHIRDGREAIKYSLGARHSLAPAWALIKACNWRLDTLIAGLEALDFGSNVRDNSLLGVHTDLSVRRYFARERHISSPSRLGLLTPLQQAPDIWDAQNLCRLLANDQWQDLHSTLSRPTRPADACHTDTSSTGALCSGTLQPRTPALRGDAGSGSASELLLRILDQPQHWFGLSRGDRLYLLHRRSAVASLIPDLRPPQPRWPPPQI